MHEHANPIEFLIDFAWANGADLFTVNNAKDELKRLKRKSDNIYDVAYWARVNRRGDIYDARLVYNPYVSSDIVLPLYSNRNEFLNLIDKLK